MVVVSAMMGGGVVDAAAAADAVTWPNAMVEDGELACFVWCRD